MWLLQNRDWTLRQNTWNLKNTNRSPTGLGIGITSLAEKKKKRSHFQLNPYLYHKFDVIIVVRTAAWLVVKRNLKILTWPLPDTRALFYCVSGILEATITPTLWFTPKLNIRLSYSYLYHRSCYSEGSFDEVHRTCRLLLITEVAHGTLSHSNASDSQAVEGLKQQM